MPYFRVSPVAAGEGAAFVDFTVTLDQASTNEIKVNYATLNGSAAYNSSAPDFQALSGTLTFAAGETSKALRVNLVNNTTLEGTELFWLNLSSPVNATVSQALTPALLFDNDATAGTPAIAVSDVVVDEAERTASFFVWLNKPSTAPVTVNYATADDSASAGQDYAANAGVLSFAAGEVLKTVTVNITDDGLAEADEFFKLVLANATNATIVDGTGQAQIGRNDQAPVGAPYITARPIAADERQPVASFVVQLSAPSSNEVKVNYNLLNGTAAYNSSAPDFQNNNGTLVFAPGQTTMVVTMPIVDNTTSEITQMMWLDLNAPVNATVPQRLTPALLFDNDATAGTPAIAVTDAVVDETTGAASIFVWLNKPSVNVVTVNYAMADDTAAAGADYRASTGTLSFAPGETVKTVTIDIGDDSVAEADEFFKLVLGSPANATIVDGAGLVQIGRSDAAAVGAPYVTAKPIAGDESQPVATFVVQLSAPSSNEVRVNYNLLNGTAAYNSSAPDFQNNNGTLVFAPGQTTMVVTMPIVDNTTAEITQMMWLDLNAPVNATVPQRLTPALLFDNDATAGVPALSVTDAVVDESAGTASFFVWLNKPSTTAVTASYATANDTALAGSDYRAATGTLSFAPGETVKTVTVDILDDSLAEGNEFFTLRLGSPGNATLADGTGGVMIGRSDLPLVSQPLVLAGPITVSEGDVLASVVVQLSAPSMNEVRVNYNFINGTAAYNSSAPDFQNNNGTLVFAPGETTKLLTAALVENTSAEGPELFTLDLTSPVNAAVAQRQTSITLLDNDSGFNVFSYGIGNDQYTVGSAVDGIAESPGGGIDAVRASVSYTLPENVENLALTGSALNGIGNAGNNVFRGTAGNNSFDGREGIDTVAFTGARAAYLINGGTASRTVSGGSDGTDTLFSIERLQFSDTVLASDTTAGGNVYTAYALFNAAFNRGPNTAELSQWTAQLDRTGNLTDTAQAMVNFYAPGVPDEVLVSYLWGTIIGGSIPADALATYTGLLATGAFSQGSILALVTTLDINTVEIAGIVGQTLALDPAYFPLPG